MVAEGAVLRYAGAPFVVADGADVFRSLRLDVDPGSRTQLRDTVVLGRSGEVGGRLRSLTEVTREHEPLLLEQLDLDPAGHRTAPGLLGTHRLVDSVLWVGEPGVAVPGATDYRLVGGAGVLTRWLGSSMASSPLPTPWAA